MTKHLIVYAHPNPASFNHAILETATSTLREAGDAVVISDLYGESFAPILEGSELTPGASTPPDVRREQQRVTDADVLWFLYPIWWFDRPAVLKGWCDRVLRPGFAYRAGDAGPEGLLGRRRANLIVTFGADRGQCDLDHVVTSLSAGTLGFCGIEDVATLPLYSVPYVDAPARTEMLGEVRRFLLERRN